MSYELYKWLHLVGLITLLGGFAVLMTYFSLGAPTKKKAFRRYGFILHGVGIALLIVSGFGLLARLGIFAEMPTWVWIKLALWLVFASLVAFVKRKPAWNLWFLPLVLVLTMTAAYLGVFKP